MVNGLLKNHYSSLYIAINMKLINYQLYNLIREWKNIQIRALLVKTILIPGSVDLSLM